jgi:hypothetical protein
VTGAFFVPILALGWGGCSDDDEAKGGPVYVDPGGTHGAEITLAIVGRGRVVSSTPGLDCPSDCFVKYIFPSATADGATGGIQLKAIPTPGLQFKGWTFDSEPIGTSGRGTDQCNPVKRPASNPGAGNGLEITLPFGETTGSPPPGKEGACGTALKVPLAYKVTATFDSDLPSDIDGGDGGAGEVLYQSPVGTTSALGIGLTVDSSLWWQTVSTGLHGIARGTSPSGSLGQGAISVLSPSSTFSLFEVDAYGVAYQTTTGTLGIIPYTSSTPFTAGGSVPTCTALAVDTSRNLYCRTSTSIYRWQSLDSYATPIVAYNGLAPGNDLVVDSTSIYFSTATAILSVSLSTAGDAGIAAPSTIVSGRANPTGLESNSSPSRLWWLESGGVFTSSRTVGSLATDTNVPLSSGLTLGADPSSLYFWAASPSAIYRAYSSGGTQTVTFRTGLSGVGGVVADSTYVYWTLSDGTVRRASKTGL